MSHDPEFQRQLAKAFESPDTVVEFMKEPGVRVILNKNPSNGSAFQTTYVDALGRVTDDQAIFEAASTRPAGYPADLPFLPDFKLSMSRGYLPAEQLLLMWVNEDDQPRMNKAAIEALLNEPAMADFRATVDRLVAEEQDVTDEGARENILQQLLAAAGADGLERLMAMLNVAAERRPRFENAVEQLVDQSLADGWQVSGRESTDILTRVHLNKGALSRTISVFFYGPTPALMLDQRSS